IPAVTLMAAVFFLFIYLISLLFRPKAPKEQEAVEAPKVIEIPDELKTTNQDYDSIIEQEGNYTIAAYYPKNLDAQILQVLQTEITVFKEMASEKNSELLIDYATEDHVNYKSYRFFKRSGTAGELMEQNLLEAILTSRGQIMTIETLFEGDYKKQISARMRKRLWKENRDRPSFYEYTDPGSDVYKEYRIEEDGLVFTLDKAKLYQDEKGTFEEKITYEDMAFYLRDPLPKVPKGEKDLHHERYVDIHKPMVALTYDDGPYDKVTSKLLDLFEKHDSAATFFVVGNRVGTSYDNGCVERAVRLGCDIGNHSYTHKHELPDLSVHDMLEELGNCEDAVKAVVPEYKMRFMRPTAGAIDDRVRENAPFAIITWSLDTLDWSYRDSTQIYNEVMGSIEDGDIILMHDLYEESYEATARLIPELIDKYQFVSVSELIEYKGDEIEKGRVYKSEKD
nr:polysaccharide deacetylase family protein [Clostridiales bacterium]